MLHRQMNFAESQSAEQLHLTHKQMNFVVNRSSEQLHLTHRQLKHIVSRSAEQLHLEWYCQAGSDLGSIIRGYDSPAWCKFKEIA